MLKHVEDDGDLTVFANNAGSVLLVCEICKRQWILDSDGGGALRGQARLMSMVDSLRENPSVLERSSIEVDDLL